MAEHLVDCAECRQEEAVIRHTLLSTKELPSLKVSGDFNARLLNRIAQERFNETRSKAYLPKRAPALAWRKVVPVVAVMCLAVLASVPVFMTADKPEAPMRAETSLDDSYLTVQPDTNPNFTVNLHRDWSLDQQLAKTHRVNRISNSIAPESGAGFWNHTRDWTTMVSSTHRQSPFVDNRHRTRSVVRMYVSPRTTSQQKGPDAY
jgi:hypothetical protein